MLKLYDLSSIQTKVRTVKLTCSRASIQYFTHLFVIFEMHLYVQLCAVLAILCIAILSVVLVRSKAVESSAVKISFFPLLLTETLLDAEGLGSHSEASLAAAEESVLLSRRTISLHFTVSSSSARLRFLAFSLLFFWCFCFLSSTLSSDDSGPRRPFSHWAIKKFLSSWFNIIFKAFAWTMSKRSSNLLKNSLSLVFLSNSFSRQVFL